jgi:hypothetical protein
MAVMPGLPYPVTSIRLYEPVSRDALAAALEGATEKLSLKRAAAAPFPLLSTLLVVFLCPPLQAGRPTGKQAGSQAGRQAGRQAHVHRHCLETPTPRV